MKKSTRLTLRFFLTHLARTEKIALLGFFGAVLGVSALMAFPLLERLFVNTLVSGDPTDAVVQKLLTILLMIFGIDVLSWFGWRVAGYCISHVEAKGMASIAEECFSTLHHHSYNFFNNSFAGALVKKVNRMINAYESFLDQFFFEFTPTFFRVTLATAGLFWVDHRLGLIFLVWEIVYMGFSLLIATYKMQKYDLARAEADTRVTAMLADTMTNSLNIKLFASLPFERQRFHATTEHWFKTTRASWFFNNHVESFQVMLMAILNVSMVYMAIRLWAAGKLTVGDFVLIQAFLVEIFRQLWDFGRMIRRSYEHFANAAEMMELLTLTPEVRDRARATALTVRRGEVVFENVSFAYDPKRAPAQDEESGEKLDAEAIGLISDLSFRIKPGEKVALIGPSGGGKSTITKLLLRLFDVKSGRVLIDGADISKVTQSSLREEVALVPQDPILFHRSLMENIRYGRRDASDAEVIAAAKLAHCHDFISTMPHGYKTLVGERGVKLSGGERQRVAIARAILANTKILILDEATSSLDSESERLIQEALNRLIKNKTTFVIAHRLSTIVNMDRILVLEEGKVVEEGTHRALLTRPKSLYRKLWELQVGGYQ